MRQSKIIAIQSAPNCFKTVVRNNGIDCYYSVCVGNTLNSNKVFDACNDKITFCFDYVSITLHKFVEITKTFYKTPYKQCYPKLYTQDFKYCIFKVHISWFALYESMNLSKTLSLNNIYIKDVINMLK